MILGITNEDSICACVCLKKGKLDNNNLSNYRSEAKFTWLTNFTLYPSG